MHPSTPTPIRNLVLVLGDQLDIDSSVFEGFDPALDLVWMAEVDGEATHVWNGKPRLALFLAAMRHFRDELQRRGLPVAYRALGSHEFVQLEHALAADLEHYRPERVIAVRPGEWRLDQSLRQACQDAGVAWSERPDVHFYCDPHDFADWAKGKSVLRMEHFYRWIRKRENVLLDGGEPTGGRWNYDQDNRAGFDRRGPGLLAAPRRFTPDTTTLEAIALVEERFAGHPGSLAQFDWPLTPGQAEQALADFIEHRLPLFGRYQDAMWSDQPWLYHARLSTAMNLKLLSPRRVIAAAAQAHRAGHAPIEAVEGVVRQVIGWREYVRGYYWLRMPQLAEANQLQAQAPLPGFYWTANTPMQCLRQALSQTLDLGYAHHIQRLMVTGLFSMLLGVRPREIHAWYLAVYVDAVEWVELPNVLGMSQYADGGRMVSKPYAASGRYIQRMSNYCDGCPFDPGRATGEKACPFTTLYWDFLDRHRARFEHHPRAALQWKSLNRLSVPQLDEIRAQAQRLRDALAADAGS